MSKDKAELGRIRDLPEAELVQAADRAREELFRLRMGLATNQVENPMSVRAKRRELARIMTDIDCDECGKPMIVRTGKRGRFLGCSGYPKCRNTSEVPAKLAEELGLDGQGNAKTKAADSAPAAPEEPEITEDL